MEKHNKMRLIGLLGIAVYVIGLTAVMADVETTTVTFVIPSQVDHSIAYGGSCSTTLFYFVETDSTKDGTMTGINVTSDSDGATPCQDAGTGAMVISNVGSVNANITANFSAALPTGVVVKVATANAGLEASCSGVVDDATCGNVTGAANLLLEEDLTAQTGTEEFWWWCDMDDFNSGVATTGVERTLQTIAIDNS